jgi:hypothetical protein
MGIGKFLKVGAYDTALMIGKQECVRAMPELDVECSAGYEWNGRQCVRPQELSVCGKSAISLDYEARNSTFSDVRSALLGSNLTFYPPEDHLTCVIQLVPVPKAAQSFRARTRARLLWTGNYSLHGECQTRVPCVFAELGELSFVCPPTHDQVGTRCVLRIDQNCSDSFVRLENDQACKRLPLLTISTNSSAYIEAWKTLNGTQDTMLSAKLVSGDFPVEWNAECPDVEWLACAGSFGRVNRSTPENEMILHLITKGQHDYSCHVGGDLSGDLKTDVRFQSRAKGLPKEMEYQGRNASLPVTVRFMSVPYLQQTDVSIFTVSAGLTTKRTRYTQDVTANAFLLPWGDRVEIEVTVKDLDGLPIKRSVGLLASLPGESDGANNYARFKQTEGSNVFSVSLPSEWWVYGAVRYRIEIKADSTESPVRLEIEFVTSIIVKVAIAATLGAGLVALLIILARIVLRAGDKTEVQKILLSFLQFELMLGLDVALELWDLCSDSMVLVAIEADDIASSLRFGYRTCFGLATVASLLAISVKLKMLVRKVRRRNHTLKKRVSERTAHEDEDDEIKLEIRAIYCCVLIGACEDIPLGTLNLLYLRLYTINATPARVQSITGALLTIVSFASTFVLLGYKAACVADLPAWWAKQKLFEKSTAISSRFFAQLPRRRLETAFDAWRAAAASGKLAAGKSCQSILVAAMAHQPAEASLPSSVRSSVAHPSPAAAPSGGGYKMPTSTEVSSFSEEVVDALECLICHELLFLPVSTVCGHSFCRSCLAACIDKCGTSCPVCRAELPPTLPVLNVLLEQLVGLHRYRSTEREQSRTAGALATSSPVATQVSDDAIQNGRFSSGQTNEDTRVPDAAECTAYAHSVIAPPHQVGPTTRMSLRWDNSADGAMIFLEAVNLTNALSETRSVVTECAPDITTLSYLTTLNREETADAPTGMVWI